MTAIIGIVGREPGGMLWMERCQSKMEAVLVRREQCARAGATGLSFVGPVSTATNTKTKRNRRRCGVPRITPAPQLHGRKGYLAEGRAGHKMHRCGSVPTRVEKWVATGTHCGPSTLLGTLLLFGRRWVSSPGPSHLLIIVFRHLLVQSHGIGHVVASH